MSAADALAALDRAGAATWVLIGVAVLVRLCVGLHPHSGEGVPPMFGDYEAQRHWMEITVHTPLSEWYVDTPRNPLQYWGLDYPPLSAYQSWAYGKVFQMVEPEMVALGSSRGHESPSSKRLMRLSVVASDLLFFVPACVAFVRTFYARSPGADRAWALAVLLLQPGPLLVDHGHFQYNGISLGLALGAATAVLAGRDLLGSALYVCSLNHKQMSLFYAPAFFAHLLGKALRLRDPPAHSPAASPAVTRAAVWGVLRLGAAVALSLALCWAPFLASLEGAAAVAGRLAPIKRGLFEDHVANAWCATHIVVKWKSLFSAPALAKAAAVATLAAAAPSMLHQILRPSSEGFLYCLLNSSLAFFLFGFQVHEKSVLLPLLPAAALALRDPFLARLLGPLAAFSMWPLLRRDGLAAAYAGCLLLFAGLGGPQRRALPSAGGAPRLSPRKEGGPGAGAAGTGDDGGGAQRVGGGAGVAERAWGSFRGGGRVFVVCERVAWAGAALLHASYAFPAPARLPHLHAAAVTAFSALYLVGVAVYSNYTQWRVEGPDVAASKND